MTVNIILDLNEGEQFKKFTSEVKTRLELDNLLWEIREAVREKIDKKENKEG